MTPEPLLQHRYGNGEPWRVAVISMLLCRTRGDVAEPIIAEVFRRWDSPARLARAKQLSSVISPLGLGSIRALRIKVVAGAFDEDPLMMASELRELPGVGKYVEDAYRLVALGDLSVRPTDKALKRWMAETA